MALDPAVPPYLGVVTERDEVAPGWVHAMRITVAASELRHGYLEAGKQRELVEVPVLAGSNSVSVDVFLRTADAALITLDQAFLVAEVGRGDGGAAVVIARSTDLDQPIRVTLAGQILEVREGLRRHGWDSSTPTRAVIFGGDADGYLRQVELAVDPE
jgi:hypothetical protein